MSAVARSFRARVLTAGGWVALSYAYNQGMRLVGNLILSRLLFPELFGLMTIVQAVLTGLALLSDVGIMQSIVYNERGEEDEFFNTAWTIQLIRGFVLWILVLLLAAPLAKFYGEPRLLQLLPVVGFNAVLGGLMSTKTALADRRLSLGRITFLDLTTYTLGLAISIAWAFYSPTVWSLVAGALIGTVIKVIASHVWLEGPQNRFRLHRASVKVIMNFGRWVFVSSALTFLAGEGNRLLIGKLLDVKLLAFFIVANSLAFICSQVATTLGGKVMFPAYAEVARERRSDLYGVVLRTRALQTIPLCVVGIVLSLFGQSLIDLLYDNRYHDAGWMLRILALGSIGGAVFASYGGVLWAIGQARQNSIVLAFQVVFQLGAMSIGAHFGARGLVIGAAFAYIALYPVYAVILRRDRLWQPILDLPVLGVCALMTILLLPRI